MNNNVRKVFSCISSAVISFFLFLIPTIPLFSIFTSGDSADFREIQVQNFENEQILVGIEVGEELRLYAVEFFFNQSEISVKEIQQNADENSFLNLYCYSGASSLLERVNGILPEKIQKYVILDKNWTKNFLIFLGGAIVTYKNSYYNDSKEEILTVTGQNFDEAFSRFGGEEILESIIISSLGKDENEFYESLCFLFKNADTNLSYPDFVKHKDKFELLRR